MTWNVRTVNQCGQLHNRQLEIKGLNKNILQVFESKWRNNGDFDSFIHGVEYIVENKNEKVLRILLDKDMKRFVLE